MPSHFDPAKPKHCHFLRDAKRATTVTPASPSMLYQKPTQPRHNCHAPPRRHPVACQAGAQPRSRFCPESTGPGQLFPRRDRLHARNQTVSLGPWASPVVIKPTAHALPFHGLPPSPPPPPPNPPRPPGALSERTTRTGAARTQGQGR
jgi:hypothetical protein